MRDFFFVLFKQHIESNQLNVYREPYNQDPILISALNIVGGNRCPMDLVRVETHTQVVYSFLSVGWGFIADIDIESERLRMLGSPRFTIWSIARLIGKTAADHTCINRLYTCPLNCILCIFSRLEKSSSSVVILQN